ncbi:MAG: hypothetical protein MJ252_05280 [archaeon]|nr:hypothetical protein [archaeon]
MSTQVQKKRLFYDLTNLDSYMTLNYIKKYFPYKSLREIYSEDQLRHLRQEKLFFQDMVLYPGQYHKNEFESWIIYLSWAKSLPRIEDQNYFSAYDYLAIESFIVNMMDQVAYHSNQLYICKLVEYINHSRDNKQLVEFFLDKPSYQKSWRLYFVATLIFEHLHEFKSAEQYLINGIYNNPDDIEPLYKVYKDMENRMYERILRMISTCSLGAQWVDEQVHAEINRNNQAKRAEINNYREKAKRESGSYKEMDIPVELTINWFVFNGNFVITSDKNPGAYLDFRDIPTKVEKPEMAVGLTRLGQLIELYDTIFKSLEKNDTIFALKEKKNFADSMKLFEQRPFSYFSPYRSQICNKYINREEPQIEYLISKGRGKESNHLRGFNTYSFNGELINYFGNANDNTKISLADRITIQNQRNFLNLELMCKFRDTEQEIIEKRTKVWEKRKEKRNKSDSKNNMNKFKDDAGLPLKDPKYELKDSKLRRSSSAKDYLSKGNESKEHNFNLTPLKPKNPMEEIPKVSMIGINQNNYNQSFYVDPILPYIGGNNSNQNMLQQGMPTQMNQMQQNQMGMENNYQISMNIQYNNTLRQNQINNPPNIPQNYGNMQRQNINMNYQNQSMNPPQVALNDPLSMNDNNPNRRTVKNKKKNGHQSKGRNGYNASLQNSNYSSNHFPQNNIPIQMNQPRNIPNYELNNNQRNNYLNGEEPKQNKNIRNSQSEEEQKNQQKNEEEEKGDNGCPWSYKKFLREEIMPKCHKDAFPELNGKQSYNSNDFLLSSTFKKVKIDGLDDNFSLQSQFEPKGSAKAEQERIEKYLNEMDKKDTIMKKMLIEFDHPDWTDAQVLQELSTVSGYGISQLRLWIAEEQGQNNPRREVISHTEEDTINYNNPIRQFMDIVDDGQNNSGNNPQSNPQSLPHIVPPQPTNSMGNNMKREQIEKQIQEMIQKKNNGELDAYMADPMIAALKGLLNQTNNQNEFEPNPNSPSLPEENNEMMFNDPFENLDKDGLEQRLFGFGSEGPSEGSEYPDSKSNEPFNLYDDPFRRNYGNKGESIKEDTQSISEVPKNNSKKQNTVPTQNYVYNPFKFIGNPFEGKYPSSLRNNQSNNTGNDTQNAVRLNANPSSPHFSFGQGNSTKEHNHQKEIPSGDPMKNIFSPQKSIQGNDEPFRNYGNFQNLSSGNIFGRHSDTKKTKKTKKGRENKKEDSKKEDEKNNPQREAPIDFTPFMPPELQFGCANLDISKDYLNISDIFK